MNLFGARITPSIWITVSVAMVALGIPAAAVPEALGERAGVFAVGNAVIRVVWAVPWLMSGRTSGQPWWQPVLYSIVPASLKGWLPQPRASSRRSSSSPRSTRGASVGVSRP